MPTVEFDTQDFLALLGSDLSIEELEQAIPMIGVSLESISEESLSVEVFPNRPDMLSVEGFARALRGFLGVETGIVEYPVADSSIVLKVDASVKSVRPYVAAAQIDGVTIDDAQLKSLMNVQEKLHTTHGRNRVKVAIGVHDSDKIKPPYVYKAVAPGEASFIPLEMTEKMNLSEILTKHPKGAAYAFTLKGLKKYPVILDSKGDVLSFPPIINGELTRVTESTKNLFIEVTGWHELSVKQALNIVVSSIADRGGKIKSVEISL
ncbi:MAG: phenylalanine--tRNA ligase subunit beta [Candidatus Altiarchaeota archaeon]